MSAQRLSESISPAAQRKRARLGCKSCREGDEARHPELGRLWCVPCPIAKYMEAAGLKVNR